MKQRGYISLIEVGVFLVIVVSLPAAFMLDRYKCHSKWQASGFKTDWGLVKGCLISKDGRTWIPEENYREIAD